VKVILRRSSIRRKRRMFVLVLVLEFASSENMDLNELFKEVFGTGCLVFIRPGGLCCSDFP